MGVETKFTPGPWLPHIAFNDPEGFPELCVDVMKTATRDDYKLIAAAPELYWALDLAKQMFAANNISLPHTMEIIDAALAKATGEE